MSTEVIEKPETDDEIMREFIFEGVDVKDEDVNHQEIGLN